MRIGIVGSGKIVTMCLDALSQIEGISCDALCVREQSAEKGKALCTQYAIDKLYTRYDELLSNADIDFIYIGIPNNLHYEYTRQALEAGKHVVCEKPFTITAAQLVELAELAKQKQRFLFEAITNLYAPNVQRLKQAMTQIGQIKLVQGNYSQLSSRYAKYLQQDIHPAFDPQESGGALYDINIYNIHLCCYLLGSPTEAVYTYNEGYNGIDTSGTMVLKYPDFYATCTGAKDSQSPGHFIVQGDKGYVAIVGIPSTAPCVEIHVEGKTERYNDHTITNHMVYEFENFLAMYARHDLAKCYDYLNHSIDVMHVIESGRNQMSVFQ